MNACADEWMHRVDDWKNCFSLCLSCVGAGPWTTFNTYCFHPETCRNSNRCSGKSKDSTLRNTQTFMVEMLLASSTFLCFLMWTASCHKPGFLMVVVSLDRRWSIMHFSQKQTGAICNSVCPHSRFLQCAINEGRRGRVRCLISSKQKELTYLGIWVQAALFWTWSVLCFIGNMVSRCIQVLQCLYITWVSYVTILNSAILIKSACCGRLRPWTILICTVFFSCVLWLPLLVFPSTYTASWYDLYSLQRVSPLLHGRTQSQEIRSSVSPSS